MKVILRKTYLPSVLNQLKKISTCHIYYKEKENNDADEQTTEPKKTSFENLNSLLKSMVHEQPPSTKVAKFEVSQPSIKAIENRKQLKKNESKLSLERRLLNAAKDVAKTFGGNEKETESELIKKLLSQSVKSQSEDQDSSPLSGIIQGMKIEKNEGIPKYGMQNGKTVPTFGKDQNKIFMDKRISRGTSNELLYGGKPLNIFPRITELKGQSNLLLTWQLAEKHELKMLINQPPRNIWELMIKWTESGKLWKFPINNEQDLHEEMSTYFADHVFLDRHLESWCPQKGPVRHFMELVCVGLSKNFYLSAKEKLDHIEWYRDYFENKRTLLEEVGAYSKTDGMKSESDNVEQN